MKKIERLRWIEKTFGPRYTREWCACRTWVELRAAIRHFDTSFTEGWGIRTDTVGGAVQGYQLPILLNMLNQLPDAEEAAKKFYDEHSGKLVFILTRALPVVRCNAVAERIDQEHVFVEWNDVEKEIIQRNMYRHPENLKYQVFGPEGFVFYYKRLFRSTHPMHGYKYSFDSVYTLMMMTGADELTFSTAPDGSVVIW